MSKYKYGLCDWLFPMQGPAGIRKAAELSFEGVQIIDQGGASNNYVLNLPWVQDEYRKVMDETGIAIQTLQIQSVVHKGWMKAAPGTYESNMVIEGVKKGLEVCRALNIPCLMTESYVASAIETEQDFDNTAKNLKLASQILADSGVQLIYESFVVYEKTMELWERTDKGFKLCFDLLNPFRYRFGDPVCEAKKYDPSMIDFIHIKDAPEGYFGSSALGCGKGNVIETSKILKERGWSGWVICENNYCADPIGKEDPLVTAKKDLETMKRLF